MKTANSTIKFCKSQLSEIPLKEDQEIVGQRQTAVFAISAVTLSEDLSRRLFNIFPQFLIFILNHGQLRSFCTFDGTPCTLTLSKIMIQDENVT